MNVKMVVDVNHQQLDVVIIVHVYQDLMVLFAILIYVVINAMVEDVLDYGEILNVIVIEDIFQVMTIENVFQKFGQRHGQLQDLHLDLLQHQYNQSLVTHPLLVVKLLQELIMAKISLSMRLLFHLLVT